MCGHHVQPRNWDAPDADVDDLDFTNKGPGHMTAAPSSEDVAPNLNEKSRMEEKEIVDFKKEDAALEEQLRAVSGDQGVKNAPSGLLSGFMSSIQTSIMGKDALSPDDVQHAVVAMQKRLQQRNVSAEVSSKICASVARTLEGKRLTSFTGVAKMVRMAMADTITRILSPPRSIDVLSKIRASKARGKPYSIVFVGVNGVGKSTNLAKIAYWLRQQNLSIMIAACDTFRYGLRHLIQQMLLWPAFLLQMCPMQGIRACSPVADPSNKWHQIREYMASLSNFVHFESKYFFVSPSARAVQHPLLHMQIWGC